MGSRLLYVRIHAIEAEARAADLRALGYPVEVCSEQAELSARLREDPPDLLLYDLDRVPSLGLYIGTFLRQRRATRRVPLVYVGGKPDKVRRVRDHLPDAVFTDWDGMAEALARALDAPPVDPTVPTTEELFVGRNLHQKLGLREGSVVALVGLPDDFDLGPLPEGAQARRRAQGRVDVAILFANDSRELERRLASAERLVDGGCSAVWIGWDKGAGELTLPGIRAAANERDMVDFKVCRLPLGLSATRISRRRT